MSSLVARFKLSLPPMPDSKDGEDGRLYIIQARPEMVASERPPETFEIYALQGKGGCSRAAGP